MVRRFRQQENHVGLWVQFMEGTSLEKQTAALQNIKSQYLGFQSIESPAECDSLPLCRPKMRIGPYLP